MTAIVAVTLVSLPGLGAVDARLGGAPKVPAMARVISWGGVAMAVAYAIGAVVGTAV